MLSVTNLSAYVGNHPLFTEVSFDLTTGERLAIVGPNGCGKTTLLRIIMGEREADDGTVVTSKLERLGYLPQRVAVPEQASIESYVAPEFSLLRETERRLTAVQKEMGRYAGDQSYLSKLMLRLQHLQERFEEQGGYGLENRVKNILTGLGLGSVNLSRRVSSLSGGQKTKLALARLLLQEPTTLLLDEPTNHLDLTSIWWLERWLVGSRIAMIIVSHDRTFLDKLAGKILEIEPERHTAHLFKGNYTAYAGQREERRRLQLKQAAALAEEKAKLEDYVRRYKAGNRSKSAKDRERKLSRLEKVEVLSERRNNSFNFEQQTRSGAVVLKVNGLDFSYGHQRILSEVGFELRRGERLAIVGANGSGKTTLLRLVAGRLTPDGGEAELGHNVRQGFLTQEHDDLRPDATVLEEFYEIAELPIHRGRALLAQFGFFADDLIKRIDNLSQGEKTRLSLARLVTQDLNLLLLDEPTNHLDLWAREAIEVALEPKKGFPGGLLVVSHDRYFLERIGVERALFLPSAEIIELGELEERLSESSKIKRRKNS